MVARSKNVVEGIASSVTVSRWASSAMSGQYSSRLGSDGAALASVTGLPRAPVSSSAKRASSEVTLTPSGSVTRTGGSGLPSTGGVVNTARKSNIVGHFLGFLALTTFPVSVSTSASERSPSSP